MQITPPTRKLIKTILFLLPITFFTTSIHEFGHFFIAWIFSLSSGWQIVDLNLSLSLFENGFVVVRIPHFVLWQYLLFSMAGSLTSLVVGFIFISLLKKYRFHENYEIFLVLYGFILIMDLTLYLPIDILFLHSGDWYEVYRLYPPIIFFMAFWYGLFAVYFYKKWYSIIERVESIYF